MICFGWRNRFCRRAIHRTYRSKAQCRYQWALPVVADCTSSPWPTTPHAARCDYDEHVLTQKLGVTTRTVRKRLAHLEELGYVVNHKDRIELHDDLVLTDDSLLMAD